MSLGARNTSPAKTRHPRFASVPRLHSAGVPRPLPAGAHRRPPTWVAYLLPSMLIFSIFVIYPFFKTLLTSFYSTSQTGQLIAFVGLGNYGALLGSPRFLQVLGNTLLYVLITVPITVIVALLLAVLTARDRPGMGFFRTVFASSMGISVASAAVFWSLVFNPGNGLLNSILAAFGADKVGWLTDRGIALYSICAVTIWMNVGLCYLVLLGGVKSIDDSFYETVQIVGGGFWYRLRKVVVPLVSPSLFFVFTVSVVNAFQSFGLIDMLTQGGPSNSTNLLVYRLYKDAFVNFQTGVASAEGIVLFALVFAISFLQARLTERMVTYQ